MSAELKFQLKPNAFDNLKLNLRVLKRNGNDLRKGTY